MMSNLSSKNGTPQSANSRRVSTKQSDLGAKRWGAHALAPPKSLPIHRLSPILLKVRHRPYDQTRAHLSALLRLNLYSVYFTPRDEHILSPYRY